jgi:predicted HicB family RNase H-like nuclease
MTRKPNIGPDTEIRDIDLDKEEAYYRGARLTEERAERLAQQTLAEARRRNLIPGGKSLSGGGTHSPTVQFRVPAELREQVERRAEAEGVTVSKLARRALEQYLKAS